MVDSNQSNWDELLDVALYSLRTERQSSTRHSPFEVMFGGRQPKYEEEWNGDKVFLIVCLGVPFSEWASIPQVGALNKIELGSQTGFTVVMASIYTEVYK